MRIQRSQAEGIFSFEVGRDRFALDLDDHLTAIVGPKASGKANGDRLLKLVQAVASFERPLEGPGDDFHVATRVFNPVHRPRDRRAGRARPCRNRPRTSSSTN
jgi:hypothetical protein